MHCFIYLLVCIRYESMCLKFYCLQSSTSWFISVSSFPSCHFGKLYGVVLALAALFSLLQYLCFTLVNDVLNGDPLYVSTWHITQTTVNLRLNTNTKPGYACSSLSSGEYRFDRARPACLHPSHLHLLSLQKTSQTKSLPLASLFPPYFIWFLLFTRLSPHVVLSQSNINKL